MKDLILIGKQGSGKGTQGSILAERFQFVIFETGAELRKIAKEESDLGRAVKKIIETGDLVPNEMVMRIADNFIQKAEKETPIIFDGIPRSEEQRSSLENSLEKAGRSFHALEIKLSDAEAMKRLLIRGRCVDCGANFGGDVCPKCGSKNIIRRNDDNEKAIRKRLLNFENITLPLLENWRERGLLISVNGEQSPTKVTEAILEKLNG